MPSHVAALLRRPLDPALVSDLTVVYRIQGWLDATVTGGSHRLLALLQETVGYESALAAACVERTVRSNFSRSEAAGILLGRAPTRTPAARALLQMRAAFEGVASLPVTLPLRQAAEALYELSPGTEAAGPKTRAP